MTNVLMTVQEYAKSRGISRQAVTKAIRKKHNLPGVIHIKPFGRSYALTVEKNVEKKR